MEAVRPPRTADGEEFRFRAGRASLDLCATVLWRLVEPVELLRQPDDLARWFLLAGLWTEPHPVSRAGLRTARALREELYHHFLARVRNAEPPDATIVNRCAEHPDPAPQLTPAGQVRHLVRHPVSAALSAVARDGIELLTGSSADRLRECAAPDCAFLFVDMSRPGGRRWCAHNRCGNRQHAREHRARRGQVTTG